MEIRSDQVQSLPWEACESAYCPPSVMSAACNTGALERSGSSLSRRSALRTQRTSFTADTEEFGPFKMID